MVVSDDYHFGESLLPFWSFLKFKLFPFIDYVPARGLINYLDGFLANSFFELKAAYFLVLSNLTSLIYIFIVFMIFRNYFGNKIAFLISFLLPFFNLGVSGIDFINTGILLFLINQFFKKSYQYFIVISNYFLLISILIAPGQGGILFISIIPLIIFSLYKIIKADKKKEIKFLLFNISFLIILLFITPLGNLFYGALIYMVEQSSLNSISYGIPWSMSFNVINKGNYWLFEIVRSSFIAVICFSLFYLIKGFFNKACLNRDSIIVYSSVICIISILFIFRTAGRIDPGDFSRLGVASSWLISSLLPLLLILVYHRVNTIKIFLPIVFFLSIFGYPANSLIINNMIEKTFSVQFKPENIINGNSIGLDNIGNGIIDPKHKERLLNIKKILDIYLKEDETYLDLTNRNASYFYMNKKPPIESGAFYNIVSIGQQKRAIEILKKNPPKIVIVDADSIYHDGLRVSFRSYLLYRFVMQNYQSIEINNYIFMLRNDVFEKETIKPPLYKQRFLLDKVFKTEDIGFLPYIWGSSYSKLEQNLIFKENLEKIVGINNLLLDNKKNIVNGDDPYIVYELNRFLPGTNVGILVFSLEGKKVSKSDFFKLKIL